MILLVEDIALGLVLPGTAVHTILSDRPGLLVSGSPGYPDSEEGWQESLFTSGKAPPKGWLNVLLEGDKEPTRLWPSACGLMWIDSEEWRLSLIADGADPDTADLMLSEALTSLESNPYCC